MITKPLDVFVASDGTEYVVLDSLKMFTEHHRDKVSHTTTVYVRVKDEATGVSLLICGFKFGDNGEVIAEPTGQPFDGVTLVVKKEPRTQVAKDT
jgi:hypothetical protein